MVITYKQKYNKKYKRSLNVKNSLKQISIDTNIKLFVLKKIYNRGIAAYYNNYRSVREKKTFRKGTNVKRSMKLSPAQWSYARIYSFVMKSKSKLNHDIDLIKHK